MLPRIRAQLPLGRRALRRRRRLLLVLLAAALAASAVPGVAAAVVPPGARGTEVVVAARDLSPDSPLTAADLDTVRVATQLVPPGAMTDPTALVGARTALAIPAGTALLPAHLAGAGSSPGPGEALMVIEAPAALGPHLRAGTALEILAPDPESGLAHRIPARVVETAESTSGTAPLTGGAGGGSIEVLVAVDRTQSDELAATHAAGRVSVSVVG